MKTTQKGRLKNAPPKKPLMDYLYCEGIFTCEDILFGQQKLNRYILASRLTLVAKCELKLRVDTYLGFLQAGDDESEEEV